MFTPQEIQQAIINLEKRKEANKRWRERNADKVKVYQARANKKYHEKEKAILQQAREQGLL